MIVQDIKNSKYIYFGEDSIEIAKESERLAYIRGDRELAEAYALIAELLEHNLELMEELDK
jgi:hypothetical protein